MLGSDDYAFYFPALIEQSNDASREFNLIQATPHLQELAGRLFAHEAQASRKPGDLAEALECAFERLHRHINPLIGSGGWYALVARAVFLAKVEFAWLGEVRVDETAGNPFKNLRTAVDGHAADETHRAMTAILANIIWLLVTFIGEDLALLLVQDAWPEVPLQDLPSEVAKKG